MQQSTTPTSKSAKPLTTADVSKNTLYIKRVLNSSSFGFDPSQTSDKIFLADALEGRRSTSVLSNKTRTESSLSMNSTNGGRASRFSEGASSPSSHVSAEAAVPRTTSLPDFETQITRLHARLQAAQKFHAMSTVIDQTLEELGQSSYSNEWGQDEDEDEDEGESGGGGEWKPPEFIENDAPDVEGGSDLVISGQETKSLSFDDILAKKQRKMDGLVNSFENAFQDRRVALSNLQTWFHGVSEKEAQEAAFDDLILAEQTEAAKSIEESESSLANLKTAISKSKNRVKNLYTAFIDVSAMFEKAGIVDPTRWDFFKTKYDVLETEMQKLNTDLQENVVKAQEADKKAALLSRMLEKRTEELRNARARDEKESQRLKFLFDRKTEDFSVREKEFEEQIEKLNTEVVVLKDSKLKCAAQEGTIARLREEVERLEKSVQKRQKELEEVEARNSKVELDLAAMRESAKSAAEREVQLAEANSKMRVRSEELESNARWMWKTIQELQSNGAIVKEFASIHTQTEVKERDPLDALLAEEGVSGGGDAKPKKKKVRLEEAGDEDDASKRKSEGKKLNTKPSPTMKDQNSRKLNLSNSGSGDTPSPPGSVPTSVRSTTTPRPPKPPALTSTTSSALNNSDGETSPKKTPQGKKVAAGTTPTGGGMKKPATKREGHQTPPVSRPSSANNDSDNESLGVPAVVKKQSKEESKRMPTTSGLPSVEDLAKTVEVKSLMDDLKQAYKDLVDAQNAASKAQAEVQRVTAQTNKEVEATKRKFETDFAKLQSDHENEVTFLKQNVEQLTKNWKKEAEKTIMLEKNLREVQTQIAEWQGRYRTEVETNIAKERQLIAAHERREKDLVDRAESAESETQELVLRLRYANEQQERSDKLSKEREAQIVALSAQLQYYEKLNATVQNTLDDLNGKLRDMDALKLEKTELQNTIKDFQTKLSDTEKQIDAAKEEADQKIKEIEEQHGKDVEIIKTEIMQDEEAIRNRLIIEYEKVVRGLRRNLSKNSEEMLQLQSTASKLSTELEMLRSQLIVQFAIDIPDWVEDNQDDRRINKSRRKKKLRSEAEGGVGAEQSGDQTNEEGGQSGEEEGEADSSDASDDMSECESSICSSDGSSFDWSDLDAEIENENENGSREEVQIRSRSPSPIRDFAELVQAAKGQDEIEKSQHKIVTVPSPHVPENHLSPRPKPWSQPMSPSSHRHHRNHHNHHGPSPRDSDSVDEIIVSAPKLDDEEEEEESELENFEQPEINSQVQVQVPTNSADESQSQPQPPIDSESANSDETPIPIPPEPETRTASDSASGAEIFEEQKRKERDMFNQERTNQLLAPLLESRKRIVDSLSRVSKSVRRGIARDRTRLDAIFSALKQKQQEDDLLEQQRMEEEEREIENAKSSNVLEGLTPVEIRTPMTTAGGGARSILTSQQSRRLLTSESQKANNVLKREMQNLQDRARDLSSALDAQIRLNSELQFSIQHQIEEAVSQAISQLRPNSTSTCQVQISTSKGVVENQPLLRPPTQQGILKKTTFAEPPKESKVMISDPVVEIKMPDTPDAQVTSWVEELADLHNEAKAVIKHDKKLRKRKVKAAFHTLVAAKRLQEVQDIIDEVTKTEGNAPRKKVPRFLARMERHHKKVVEKWNKRKEAILKERQRNFELVMQAYRTVTNLEMASSAMPAVMLQSYRSLTSTSRSASRGLPKGSFGIGPLPDHFSSTPRRRKSNQNQNLAADYHNLFVHASTQMKPGGNKGGRNPPYPMISGYELGLDAYFASMQNLGMSRPPPALNSQNFSQSESSKMKSLRLRQQSENLEKFLDWLKLQKSQSTQYVVQDYVKRLNPGAAEAGGAGGGGPHLLGMPQGHTRKKASRQHLFTGSVYSHKNTFIPRAPRAPSPAPFDHVASPSSFDMSVMSMPVPKTLERANNYLKTMQERDKEREQSGSPALRM